MSSRKNSRSPEQWAELIRSRWQQNVKDIFETALMLETAREELGASEFRLMAEGELKFSKSMVSQLIAIADDDRLADVHHGKLPASWRTLYELTRLTNEQFAAGLESGVIHSGMQRKDIAQLKPKKEKPAPPPEPELKGRKLVERRGFEAWQVIVSALREMTPDERTDFMEMIHLNVADFETREKTATQPGKISIAPTPEFIAAWKAREEQEAKAKAAKAAKKRGARQ
jgi:hypothetical protein